MHPVGEDAPCEHSCCLSRATPVTKVCARLWFVYRQLWEGQQGPGQQKVPKPTLISTSAQEPHTQLMDSYCCSSFARLASLAQWRGAWFIIISFISESCCRCFTWAGETRVKAKVNLCILQNHSVLKPGPESWVHNYPQPHTLTKLDGDAIDNGASRVWNQAHFSFCWLAVSR